MTREEAIKVLKNTVDNINYDKNRDEIYFTHEWVGAYEMAIAALREQPRWISVEERLPTEADANPYESVLAIAKDDGFARSWCWDIVEHYPSEFTHWMPLPESPKEEV